jgi:hypothetical protein
MSKNIDRHIEKQDLFLRWLLFFDFTNRNVVSKLLGVSDGALSYFYRSLIKKNYIEMKTDPIAISGNKIIMLTRDGFSHAMTRHLDIKEMKFKKSIAPTMVRHQIILQEFLVDLGLKSDHVVSDKILRKSFDNIIVPDAIALIENQRVAVEMELTRKKPAQIYHKFQRQIEAIEAKRYSKVIWVFDDEKLKNYYQKLCDEVTWPVCKVVNSRVVVVYEKDSNLAYLCNPVNREKIEFRVN